jgi:hypothetical protein
VLTSIIEPTLAMTSLITHPQTPFTLISCHFDSSILFWSLLSLPDVSLSQIKLLIGSPANSIFCEANEALVNSDQKSKISGKKSL